jgi:hypothetical protein
MREALAREGVKLSGRWIPCKGLQEQCLREPGPTMRECLSPME